MIEAAEVKTEWVERRRVEVFRDALAALLQRRVSPPRGLYFEFVLRHRRDADVARL